MKLLLCVWFLSAACVTYSSAQDCTEESLVDNFGSRDQEMNSGLVSLALDAGQGTTSNVRILDQNIVCLATDTTRGQYRQASVVVEYTLNGNQMLSQIEFSCVSGAWSETVGSLSSRVMTPPNADLTTATRRDCEFCLDSDPTHCTACPSSCVGLKECTSSNDCCNYVEDDMCVANCSTGRTLIPDNFTCAISCGSLETPANGTIMYSDDQLEGSMATYSCNEGFIPEGGDETRTCGSTGSWDGTAPSCIPPRPPTVSQSQLLVEYGEAVSIQCSILSSLSSERNITWVKLSDTTAASYDEGVNCGVGEEGLEVLEDETVVANSSVLNFTITFGDEGSYICLVTNTINNTIDCHSDVVYITVSPQGGVSIANNDSQVYRRGEDATLVCSGQGGPENMFEWRRNEELLVQSMMLEIANINASSGGEYTCVVSNEAGNDSASVSLNVVPYFIIQPESAMGSNGTSSVVLMCEAESFPAPEYQWGRVDGRELGSNVMGSDSVNLTLSPLLFGDEGEYYCNVSSGASTVQSSAATLTIAPFAMIVTSLEQTFEFGDNITLECSGMGGPGNMYQWQFRGENIDGENSTELTLASITASDGGEYSCVVSNGAGNSTASTTVFIRPYFTSQPQNVELTNGSVANLSCEAEAFPSPEYQWMRGNGQEVRSDLTGRNTSELIFAAVFGDEGEYYCNVLSRGMYTQSQSATITISPEGSVSAPSIINSQLEETERFICTAMGGPGNNFTWIKIDDMSVIGNTAEINITIDDVLRGGVYECTVTNNAGNDTAQTTLNIAPHFIDFSMNFTVANLENISLECEASGFPLPDFVWYHNDTILLESDRVTISETVGSESVMSRVGVTRAMANDTGSYLCNVTSSVQEYDSVTRSLTVIVQNIPEQPQNVMEIDVTSREVNLTWMEPHDNNAPILGYLVRYMEPDFVGGDLARVVNTSVEIATITDLSPGVDYEFTVTAYNLIGSSSPSDTLTVRTLDEVPSEAPGNVTASALNSTSIMVRWEVLPPAERNGIITVYEVMYQPMETFGDAIGTEMMNVSGSEMSVVLDGLEEFVVYNISVQAYTSVGPGPYSNEVPVRTTTDVPSEAPGNVTASALNSTSIMVRWEVLPPADRNGIIAVYEVVYQPMETFDDAIGTEMRNVSGSETSVVLDGLEEFVNYTISVQAYTSVGPGPESETVTARTYEDAPSDFPVNVTALVNSSTSIMVTWGPVPLRDQNGIITDYEVMYEPLETFGGSISTLTVNVSGSNISVILVGLEAFVVYNISVRAYTNVGPGPYSNEIPERTTTDVPASAPVNIMTQILSSTSIMVTWGPVPDIDQNGVITGYDVMYEPLETFSGMISTQIANVSESEMSAILIGLEEFVNYTISVRASTSAGPGPFSGGVTDMTDEDAPSGKPVLMRAADVSPTEVVVEWTEVDAIERNGIIIAYEVVYVPLDSIGVADVRNTSNTTIRLEGLEESVEYTIRVRAFTRVGPGPFSDPRNSTAQEDVPGSAPVNVNATPISSTSIMVTWGPVPDIDQNGIITGYEVMYEPLETFDGNISTLTVNVSGSDLSTLLMELQEFVDYSISVRAYTIIGPGPYSDEEMARTNEDVPDSAPVITMAFAISSTSIMVTWGPVPDINQNGIITEYEVMYEPLETFNNTIGIDMVTVRAPNTSVLLNGLQEYVNYSIRVRAFTSVGPSNYSSPVQERTNEDVPSGAPMIINAMEISSTEVLVIWSEVDPMDQNGIIIMYEVDYQALVTFGSPGDLSRRNTTNTTITLRDLHESAQYNITVRAFTSIGPGPFSPHVISTTQEDVPRSPPANVSINDVSSTTIMVSWSPVPLRDQNGAIVRYEVMYEPLETFGGNISTLTANVLGSNLSVTLIGLQEFVNYSISVRAYTIIGPGPYSDEVMAGTNEDAPSNFPVNVTTSPTSSTSIMVTWDSVPAIDQNGVITEYEVMYEPLETFGGNISTQRMNVTAPKMSVTLNGLEEFVNYSISVRAYTIIGPGPYSDGVMARTNEDVPARPPTITMATAVSSTSIMVTWDPVPAIDQNGVITEYEVMYEPLETFNNTIGIDMVTVRAPNTSVLLNGLQEYVNYSIRVRAFTSVGPSNYSSPVQERTNEDVPSGFPVIRNAMEISSTEVLVTWSEVNPIDRNGIIIAYEVDYQALVTFGSPGDLSRKNTTNTTITLRDLHESAQYNITVRAFTSIGPGPFSPHVISTTQEDVPQSSPTNVAVNTVSSTSIMVTWGAVPLRDQNGIITEYEVMYEPLETFGGDITTQRRNVTAPEMSVTLTDLEEFVNYSISVRAYTRVGAGPFSEEMTEMTNEDAPSNFPVNVATSPISSTSIMVTWGPVPVIDQNGIITGYEVMYEPLETFGENISTLTVNVSGSDLSTLLMELQEFVNYSISVRAYTIIGPGLYSEGVVVMTNEDAPSNFPVNVATSPISSTSIMVTWGLVPAIDQNGVITEYEVMYEPLETFGGNISTQRMNVTAPGMSVILTKLQEFVTYSISVRAYTAVGEGPFSTPQSETTLQDEPSSPPTNVSAIATSPRSIAVEWQEVIAINRNGDITMYEVRYRPMMTFEGRIGTEMMNATELRTNLSALEEYVDYAISVRAYTNEGPGPYSNEMVVMTPQDVPSSPPQDVVLTVVSANEIKVSWNEVLPINQSGIIILYGVLYQPMEAYDRSSLVQNTTNSSIALRGLHEYANYSVQVQAYTVIGPGPFSNQQSIRTNETAPDSPPQSVSAVEMSSTSIRVTWEEIPEVNRNGEIIAYEVEFGYSSATIRQENTTMVLPPLVLELKGLDEDETYSIRVRGYTSVGPGPYISPPVEERTPEDRPGPVGKPPAVDDGMLTSTSARLQWDLPDDPNGDIMNYTINIRVLSSNPLAFMMMGMGGGDRRKRQISNMINNACILGGESKTDFNVTTTDDMILLTNLTPFAVYEFRVLAATAIGNGIMFSPPRQFITLESNSTRIQNLNVTSISSTTIRVTWNSPECPYGNITRYTIYYRLNDVVQSTNIDNSEYTTRRFIPVMGSTRHQYEIEGLTPYKNYTVHVQAVVTPYLGTDQSDLIGAIEEERLARTRSAPDLDAFMLASTKDPTSGSIEIQIRDPKLIDTGRVILCAVIVILPTSKSPLRNESTYNNVPPYMPGGSNLVYVAAAWDEGEINASRVPSVFTVGNSSQDTYTVQVYGRSTTYTNVRLSPDTDYTILVRYDIDNDNIGGTEPHRTYSNFISIKTDLPYSPAGLAVGIIIIMIVIVIAIVLVVIIIYFYKKRKYGKFAPNMKNDHLPLSDVERKDEKGEEKGFFFNPIADVNHTGTHNPVPIEDFANHVRNLHANDNYLYTEEYALVEPDHRPLTENTRRPENIQKNRYANITSYDHSRVKLEEIPDEPGSDYINANFIDGYRATNYFIATQGPVPGTVPDFWRMIWEQGSATIVMLTNCEEKGRIKCHKYWPDDLNKPVIHGRTKITLQECLVLAAYTVRTFSLQMEGSKSERIVRHFHFTIWPDHGVPEEPSPLLHFVRKVTQSNPRNAGPMIVHCSAGVGRTGTFITIQSQLLRIRNEGTVDIFNFVQNMRSRRCFMVQTESQYIFLHDALLEALECGESEVAARDLYEQYKQLKNVDPETMKTRLDLEFKRLSTTVHHNQTKINATLPLNKIKNRHGGDESALPYDKNRARLTSIPGVQGSDYINASFIDGYHHCRQFIATQGPLPDTTDDFWRMVFEQKCSTIVMLTKEKEGGRIKCHKYWPEEGAVSYSNLQVIAHNKSTFPDYILREITLVNTRDSQDMSSHNVKLFQFMDWPEEIGAVPSHSTGLIDLIGQVQKWQISSGNRPIVVHCSGGCGRTGTFIAVSILLERLKTEGVVDVFNTVRSLRLQRPGMVQSVPQYEFCFKTVLEFLESFEHYSNFK